MFDCKLWLRVYVESNKYLELNIKLVITQISEANIKIRPKFKVLILCQKKKKNLRHTL